ncbi:MAG: V-type ATP synthase subunit E family protein [Ruthenibacterium sp.]|nr:V-type ATP synthase subunit E family protein [Ruthenibacterium sp.]
MAQKNKQSPFGTQSSADAQRSEMFEASVLKSASMEAQQIVQEGEKEARQIVEQARHSSVDTQLDAYRRAAKRAAALEAAVARRENRDRLLRYRTQLVNGLFAEAQEAALAFAQSGQAYAAFVQAALARHRDACAQGPCRVLVRKADLDALAGAVKAALPGCKYELCADAAIALGGAKLACGNVLFDETLDDRLASLREEFLGRCGLRVQ